MDFNLKVDVKYILNMTVKNKQITECYFFNMYTTKLTKLKTYASVFVCVHKVHASIDMFKIA